jgi:hypothetical protein
VGDAATTEPRLPHLTPTLSAPRGGEGGFNKLFYIGSKMCGSRSPSRGACISSPICTPAPRWGRGGGDACRVRRLGRKPL